MTVDGDTVHTEPVLDALTEAEAAEDVCRFVTVGRRSGRRHDIEIWFATTGPVVYLISGNGPGADWFQNALANPDVELRVGDRTFDGVAREVADPGERRLVGELMLPRHGTWGGDPDIGLTIDDWLWTVPALAIDSLRAR